MNDHRDHVRRSFAVITALMLLVTISAIYRQESVNIARYTVASATVIAIDVGPRTRKAVLAIDVDGNMHKTVANLVLFSQLQLGQVLPVRYDPENMADVEIDSFWYIHSTSMGMTAGLLFLFVIVAAALRRVSRRNQAGGQQPPMG
ncbi:MAG: hypothetical protein ABIL58_09935 [Pseudomonadota bacterium]